MGGNYPGGKFSGGNFPGGSCPGGSFPGWEFSGWEFPWVGVVRVGIFLGENCPGGIYPGWEFSLVEVSQVGIVRWDSSGWQFLAGSFHVTKFPTSFQNYQERFQSRLETDLGIYKGLQHYNFYHQFSVQSPGICINNQ